jgi:23S rRNA (uracil1939-C5)-methyltransferase
MNAAPLSLTIEKMVYGGDGLARLGPSQSNSAAINRKDQQPPQKAVFVPFVLTGERVEVEIVDERPGFVRGRSLALLSRSPHRIEPGCPYFGRCGGCQYQHASYEHQSQIKQEVLRESLRRIAKIELNVEIQLHSSPSWEYRNRTRLKVQSGRLGYFAHASHEFVEIERCPISSPLLNRAIAALGSLSEFQSWSHQVAEVEWFADHDDTALLAGFYARRPLPASKFRGCFEALAAALPELRGVALMPAEDDGESYARIPSDERAGAQILGERWLQYASTVAGPLHASVEAFFQTNRFLVDALAGVVTARQAGRRALDLYAGVGMFSVPLAGAFEHVTAVEIAPAAVAALRANAAGRFEVVETTTERFLRSHGHAKYDLVVVDPPRGGLGEATARALAALDAPRLTYVSCDPATLSRDLRVLLASGFQIQQAHLLDLFPQTFHLETVLQLVR